MRGQTSEKKEYLTFFILGDKIQKVFSKTQRYALNRNRFLGLTLIIDLYGFYRFDGPEINWAKPNLNKPRKPKEKLNLILVNP